MTVVRLLLLALLLTSCTDRVIFQIDPFTADSNALIVSELILGDPKGRFEVLDMDSDGGTGFYFSALVNGEAVAGRVAVDGSILWTRSVEGSVADVLRVPTSSGATKNALTLCGEMDTTMDGKPDAAYVTLLDPTGDVIRTVLSTAPMGQGLFRHICLHAVGVDDFILVAAGRMEQADASHPYLARFSVNNTDTISEIDNRIYSDTGVEFSQLILEGAPLPSGYFAVMNLLDGKRILQSDVWKLSDTFDVDWRTALGVRDDTRRLHDAMLSGVNLIAVGEIGIMKDEEPWKAALITSIGPGGTVSYVQKAIFSEFSDEYDACFAHNGELFAVGQSSSVFDIGTGRVFGLGLASRIDRATGDVLANGTFGSMHYSSAFLAVYNGGANPRLAGFTDFPVDVLYQRGWITEINVDQLNAVELPVVRLHGDIE